MTIEYDGTNFCGWQVQKDSRTVQGDIEFALQKITKNKNISLIGSGRTDSGVHALGQVANVKLDISMNESQLMKALNANLDNDVYIKDCQIVASDFHSRFLAVKREYQYNVTTSFSPRNRYYIYDVEYQLNPEVLADCAEILLGEHDFTELSKYNSEIKNKICKIYHSEWTIKDNLFSYNIIGNRFLHHMVRYIVGLMIEISRQRSLTVDHLIYKLNGNNEGAIFKAPSKGLYLKNVFYE